jgi:OHCU decarboxylase
LAEISSTRTGVADLKKKGFRTEFGAVYEHSPWVADAVFEKNAGIADGGTDADALIKCFESEFMAASRDLQLATLRAHPELACALDDREQLTTDSIAEQTGVGLDLCSEAEFAEFGRLNAAYSEKFGFPFIIAVKGRSRLQILNIFRMRLQNDAVLEFQSALYQVCRIARFRIEGILSD